MLEDLAHHRGLDDLAITRIFPLHLGHTKTWGFDVLVCPRCAHRMRVVATITEPRVVRRILEHLRVRAEPLARAPARDPEWYQVDLGFDADAAAA